MSSSNSFLLKTSKRYQFLKIIYLYYNIYIRNFKFYFNGSQFKEEKLILKHFKKNHKGNFIDVGCFHPTRQNNTFKMYKNGWHGINIDLNKLSIDFFNIARPKDINIHAALSDKEGLKKLYYLGELATQNTLEKNHINFLKKVFSIKKNDIVEKKVKTQKLETILEKYNFYKIDFMNIDIEGYELKILNSLNFKKFDIKIICIELLNHNKKSTVNNIKIINFLKKNKYFLVDKIKESNYIFKKR